MNIYKSGMLKNNLFVECLAICLAMILTGIVVYGVTSDLWRADAVKRGYAKWVVDNEFGKTHWEWIEQKPAAK